MKAIVKVNRGSNYSKVNGLTFEVAEANESFVSVIGANEEFPNNQVDFLLTEVIIVDIQKHIDEGLNQEFLTEYCRINKIKYNGAGKH